MVDVPAGAEVETKADKLSIIPLTLFLCCKPVLQVAGGMIVLYAGNKTAFLKYSFTIDGVFQSID